MLEYLWGYSTATVTGASAHAVAVCRVLSKVLHFGTALYETYVVCRMYNLDDCSICQSGLFCMTFFPIKNLHFLYNNPNILLEPEIPPILYCVVEHQQHSNKKIPDALNVWLTANDVHAWRLMHQLCYTHIMRRTQCTFYFASIIGLHNNNPNILKFNGTGAWLTPTGVGRLRSVSI